MQQAAADVLRRSMRAGPKLRNSLLLSMAAFASRLPEDYPEVRRINQVVSSMPRTITPVSGSRVGRRILRHAKHGWLKTLLVLVRGPTIRLKFSVLCHPEQ